jgi:hypothetical protein
MLASLRTFEKVLESRIFGSLQQNPFFVPPEEFLSELRERRAKQTMPKAVDAWKCNSDIVMALTSARREKPKRDCAGTTASIGGSSSARTR